MTTITLAIPSEMKKEMEKFKGVNWSEVARIAFQRKLQDMKFLQDLTSDSEISSEDAERIGRAVSEKLGARYTGDS